MALDQPSADQSRKNCDLQFFFVFEITLKVETFTNSWRLLARPNARMSCALRAHVVIAGPLRGQSGAMN